MRLRIVQLLLHGRYTVGELAEDCERDDGPKRTIEWWNDAELRKQILAELIQSIAARAALGVTLSVTRRPSAAAS